MIGREFFAHDPVTCARELIGCELVWGKCAGIVVETEAYAAIGDDACHTFSRPSAREFVARHRAGAAYVYFNYGMYWLFNLLVKGGDRDGLILVRALEPRVGIEQMQARRRREKLHELCSGPGKLAMALGITGDHHGTVMTGKKKPAGCGLRAASADLEVVSDIRVGISQAVDFPWRFLVRDNAHVSVKHGRVKLPLRR